MALHRATRKPAVALVLALAAALALLTRAQPVYTLMGGWFPATRNEHTERVLAQALGEAGSGGTRLCFSQVDAIQQQLVDGLNFRYYMKGCALPGGEEGEGGRCAPDACATPELFQVDVFCQPWTSTARVLGVARL